MIEYDQLCRILDSEFLASPQEWMIEEENPSHKPQKVMIDDSGKSGLTWELYKFEAKDKEFLPFFNKTNDAPEGLRKFCDYVLLVGCRDKTFVMLIELKRGDTGTAKKQLNASETFIKYLYLSAERLHQDFNELDFNQNNITLLKFIVKERKAKKCQQKVFPPSISMKNIFISRAMVFSR